MGISPRIMKELCHRNPVPSLKHPKRRPVLGKTKNRKVRGNFIGGYGDFLSQKPHPIPHTALNVLLTTSVILGKLRVSMVSEVSW